MSNDSVDSVNFEKTTINTEFEKSVSNKSDNEHRKLANEESLNHESESRDQTKHMDEISEITAQRSLHPDVISLLKAPELRLDSLSPIDFQFYKLIGVFLESKGIHFSKDFLLQLSDLGAMCFHNLINSLQKYTEVQRRRIPSIEDTSICLRVNGINPNSLYKELNDSSNLSQNIRERIKSISDESKEISKGTKDHYFEEDDSSLPFFANEHYEITELVPKQSAKPDYIPQYLPDLPPDYTYQNTPKFPDTLTDLKDLRLKLVEESRLTEKSLYNLIEDDENKWQKVLESEIHDNMNDDNESEMEDTKITEDLNNAHPDFQASNFDTQQQKDTSNENEMNQTEDKNAGLLVHDKTVAESKAFDFEEYAKKRLAIRINKTKDIQRKRELRESNIFIKAEKYYSPYQKFPITPEIDHFFENALKEEFRNVIKSVRASEKKKRKQVQKIIQDRARKEKEKELQKEKLEFGFNINHIDHSSDEDSDDGKMEENVLEFNFPGSDREADSSENGTINAGNSKDSIRFIETDNNADLIQNAEEIESSNNSNEIETEFSKSRSLSESNNNENSAESQRDEPSNAILLSGNYDDFDKDSDEDLQFEDV